MARVLGGLTLLALAAGCHGSPKGSPDAGIDAGGYATVTCPALPAVAAGTCSLTGSGAGYLISGNVLAPDTLYLGGQVAVSAAGTITCVGCSCPEAGATQISCPQGVISPGLINAHDHIDYTQDNPYTPTPNPFDGGGLERYEHRNDWRIGLNGHTAISSYVGGASVAQIQWGELRFLLGGATSAVSSAGAPGLVRNLNSGNEEEGLGQPPVVFDTFPLGDTDGTQLASGCGYPKIETPGQLSGANSYEPHVAEGIRDYAENEFQCLSSANPPNDLILSKTAVIHAVGLHPAAYQEMAKAGWSMRLSGSRLQLCASTSRK